MKNSFIPRNSKSAGKVPLHTVQKRDKLDLS